jgi:hypothetical protein
MKDCAREGWPCKQIAELRAGFERAERDGWPGCSDPVRVPLTRQGRGAFLLASELSDD